MGFNDLFKLFKNIFRNILRLLNGPVENVQVIILRDPVSQTKISYNNFLPTLLKFVFLRNSLLGFKKGRRLIESMYLGFMLVTWRIIRSLIMNGILSFIKFLFMLDFWMSVSLVKHGLILAKTMRFTTFLHILARKKTYIHLSSLH